MTKICTKCNVKKLCTEFAFRNKKLKRYASNCKQCQKPTKDKHYIQHKQVYIEKAKNYRIQCVIRWKEYKATLSCSKCKENRLGTIDFHHPNMDKEDSLANLVYRQFSWNRLMKEVKKCIILCANCHRNLHYIKQNEAID